MIKALTTACSVTYQKGILCYMCKKTIQKNLKYHYVSLAKSACKCLSKLYHIEMKAK